jgi:lysophospholipase L1-like esterase
MLHVHRLLFLVGILALPATATPIAAADFPLQDGDVWVMAGDSITAQHQHSNYFEAFCYARYPKMKFAFRNSGVGGHTIPSTLDRFDYDIAVWKPTVVSVELGMNDKGSTATDKFISNMGKMVERIHSAKARPVIFAPSPINDGSTMSKLEGGNKRLSEYADALKEFAAKEKAPYADQFHALIDIWGRNKAHEPLALSLPLIKQLAKNDALEGVEHLRQFLAAQEKANSKPVALQGDPVHPGPPGQLMMAAALLKALAAQPFVSSATIAADGKVGDIKGCKIDAAKAAGSKLTFDRLDDCLPFPIPDEARQVLPLYPVIEELSQYTLKVTGLKEGNYLLKINDVPAAKLSAKELDAGVNLTTIGMPIGLPQTSPIVAQSRAVLNAVALKENVVNQVRQQSRLAHDPKAKPELKEQLGDLIKKVEAADQQIRKAATPQKLHFELVPTK